MLTSPELIVLAIIALLFILIFLTQLKTELIAIIILLTLTISGQITVSDALSGFSSSVVITLIGLFIITHALEETGVIQWIANQLNAVGGGSELKLMALFMVAGATLSLIMNNVAAGAVLLPAAVKVARISNVSISKLLMPMSFGTLLGGMATYLTTANILMSELLITRDFKGLGMLDFMPTGAVIVLAGVVYMLLIGRHALPKRTNSLDNQPQPIDLKDTYHLNDQLWQVRITANSRLANKTIKASDINAQLGLTIATIWRDKEAITIPKSDQVLYPNDELLIIGREDRVQQLLTWGNVLVDASIQPEHHDLPIEPIEIIIAPRSDAIGKTLSEMKLNREVGLLALSLWRDGESYHTDVRKMPLEIGDAVLVVGQSSDIQDLANNPNYILPSGRYSELSMRPEKAPQAITITAIALILGIFDILPLPIAMLAGATAMVVVGCLSMEEFYDAIAWRVIFLVAGMLPLSLAITQSGLADRIGNQLVIVLADSNPIILVAGMIILTMLVVQIIGGQVTALLVGPIAINAAVQIGVDPRAMAVAVAMACSMAFLTPIAHPVNILMMGPGGYKFSDFFIIGLGMTIVTTLAMLLGLSLFWGI
ncbi:MAG: SLC13 family permease [Phototrophicaceae bacterium]